MIPINLYIRNMEQKGHVVALVLLFKLFVYCMVGSVKGAILDTSNRQRGSTGNVDLCADIIGPQWNMTKQRESPCPTLVVWVPRKTGFTEFVKINSHHEVEGGFSIAVFCHALQLLPYKIQPIFKPFINESGKMNGSYDQLLRHIEGQSCQAVAGDVTIRGNQAQYVDFTIPYLSAEVYMLVRAAREWNQSLWTFLRPFTTRLWITLAWAYVLTGVALSFLEYRADNHRIAIPLYRQLMMVIWFPISTFFFNEGKIVNRCSKVVLVMWLCMLFIVLQIFTATLSSWLTLDQLSPRLPSSFEKAGYQGGSFIKDLIMEQYNCSGKNFMALNSYEDFRNALSDGSVNAVFDLVAYIDIFLSKYGSEYMKFGPITQEPGMAFAFPRGSPFLQDFSRAVINVTESEVMMEMKRNYLGFSTSDHKKQHIQALPQSLDVESFIGLFVLMAIITIVAIISSEISLMRRNNKAGTVKEELKEQQVVTSEQVQIQIHD